jgi:PmbA protein
MTSFFYTPERFRAICEQALARARKLGAAQADCHVSEGYGLAVGTRKLQVERIEYNRDKSFGVTVFVGKPGELRRGHSSSSDLSESAIDAAVRAAFDIARYTAPDDCAGLPDPDWLEREPPDLDLLHPWEPEVGEALELCRRMEDAAFSTSRHVTNSEGASLSAQQSHFVHADSNGFRGGYGSSRHTLACTPIAGRGDDMHVDSWYSSMRDPRALAAPEAIGRYAAERALSRRHARKIDTRVCPVLFESQLAAGLLGAYVQATSGGLLYRKASFLLDSIGKPTWADHIDIDEDPHLPGGKASAPFDDEGVRTRKRRVVDGGVTQNYFLSSYTGRKLGMASTGHGGGSHNLLLHSRLTQPADDLPAMLRKLDRGLFVIELMGDGANLVTGDYSRGAFGFWVEGGVIAHPVHEVTIAGNLRTMLRDVQAIGADTYTYGGKTTGSLLIGSMTVAGN